MDCNYIQSHVDFLELQNALLNSINPNKETRKISEYYLSEEKNKKDFLPSLFQIIEQNQNNANNLDLLAIIFLKKYFETSYK